MAKESVLTIAADPALIYEILTDYESLAEWLPFVAGSRLLAAEGDLALAELDLRDGESARCAMECVHSRDRLVVWQPLADRVPVTRFEWSLESMDDGLCRVTAAAEKTSGLSFLSSRSGGFLDPESCLNALEKQASLFAADGGLADGCEKLLEIVETASGLVCWLRGKKYRLVPDGQ